MSRPIVVKVGPLASAVANNIALSQTPAGAGAITLNGALVTGGVAVLDTARRVLLTTNADETSKTFTIRGANWQGDTISEVLAGVSSTTAYSVLDYKTVTSITVSAATAGAITFGTNGVAGSPWVPFDPYYLPQVSIQCTVSGTANYTVQQTLDDPNSPTNPVAPSAMTWLNHGDPNLVGATTSIQSNYAYPPAWARILLNSETGSASVTGTFAQSGGETI